jgi:hypothetical protein
MDTLWFVETHLSGLDGREDEFNALAVAIAQPPSAIRRVTLLGTKDGDLVITAHVAAADGRQADDKLQQFLAERGIRAESVSGPVPRKLEDEEGGAGG